MSYPALIPLIGVIGYVLAMAWFLQYKVTHGLSQRDLERTRVKVQHKSEIIRQLPYAWAAGVVLPS